MKISTKGRYALRVMIDLASQDQTKYIPLKEIAARQGISKKYLEALIKRLVKDQFIQGIRGKGGGYRLIKAPETITVLDVLESMEDDLAPVACLGAHAQPCHRKAQCQTLPIWQGLYQLIVHYFSSITLKSLLETPFDIDAFVNNAFKEERGKVNR